MRSAIPNEAAPYRAFDDGLASTATLLSRFWPATNELLERRTLLRRVDTKYVTGAARMTALLEELSTAYAAVRVPAGSIAMYRSLYFDTDELTCFNDHRRGRRIRHKIRIRHYPDRSVSFLEVKTKRTETLTDKHRLELAFGTSSLGERERAFLRARVPFADGLQPRLWIEFRRITLIGIATNERVTFDFDLDVIGLEGMRRRLGEVAVVEVKQPAFNTSTPVMRTLARAGLRERSMSKYAASVATIDPDVRRNRLIPTLRLIARTS